MATKLTAGQSLQITSACIRQITHSTRPLNQSEELKKYNVNTTQQISAIRSLIVTDTDIGVPHYTDTASGARFRIDANSLKDMSKDWTILGLATIIRSDSVLEAVASKKGAAKKGAAFAAASGNAKKGAKKSAKKGTKKSTKKTAKKGAGK